MTTFSDDSQMAIQAYLTGSLDAESTEQFAKAVEADPELAAELALWRAARGVHAEDVAKMGPGAFGWARIERELAAKSVEADTPNANDNAPSRPAWSRRIVAPWQAAAAVVVAGAGWQAAVVPTLTPAQLADSPEYALAAGADDAEFVLRISFVESATESDMRRLLRDSNARIIDGPSATGLYTLAFDDALARDAARDTLANAPAIVREVVEP